MTWVLNIWNLIFLIWVIAAIAGGASDDPNCGELSKETCNAAADVGTGIGVALVIFLWFVGFIVLSIVWFMTRRKGRTCPHCGEDVKKGRTACQKCGYDFTLGRNPTLDAPPAGA